MWHLSISRAGGGGGGGWDEEVWRGGLTRLREEIVRANVLVREANLLAEELTRPVTCSVTLQGKIWNQKMSSFLVVFD